MRKLLSNVENKACILFKLHFNTSEQDINDKNFENIKAMLCLGVEG